MRQGPWTLPAQSAAPDSGHRDEAAEPEGVTVDWCRSGEHCTSVWACRPWAGALLLQSSWVVDTKLDGDS